MKEIAKGMHKPGNLAKRQAAFAQHGATPAQNPGKNQMQMTKPGSLKK